MQIVWFWLSTNYNANYKPWFMTELGHDALFNLSWLKHYIIVELSIIFTLKYKLCKRNVSQKTGHMVNHSLYLHTTFPEELALEKHSSVFAETNPRKIMDS